MRLRRSGQEIRFLRVNIDGLRCVECEARYGTRNHQRMLDICYHEKCWTCLMRTRFCRQCNHRSFSSDSDDDESESDDSSDSSESDDPPDSPGAPAVNVSEAESSTDCESDPIPSCSKDISKATSTIQNGSQAASATKGVGVGGIKCPKCGNCFPTRGLFIAHLITHRMKVAPKTAAAAPQKPTPTAAPQQPKSETLTVPQAVKKMKNYIILNSKSKQTLIRLRNRKKIRKSKPVGPHMKLKELIGKAILKKTYTKKMDLQWICRACGKKFEHFQQLRVHKKHHIWDAIDGITESVTNIDLV